MQRFRRMGVRERESESRRPGEKGVANGEFWHEWSGAIQLRGTAIRCNL